MNKNKLMPYIIGGFFSLLLLIGIILLFAPKVVTIVIAVIVICLSLASGLIIPNPISFIALVAGICMLVFPSFVVGIILICLSLAGALINLFMARKLIKD